MNISISQQKQDLQAQIAEANEKIASLEGKLRALDAELAGLLSQKAQYQLLDEFCTTLEKSSKIGAANLFLEATGSDPEKQLQRVREFLAGYQQKIPSIGKSRSVLQVDIQNELESVRILRHQLAGLEEKAPPVKSGYKVGLQAREISYRAMILPWSHQGGEERRFRTILLSFLLFAIVFGAAVPFLKPPVEQSMGIVVPERIARIIKKKEEAKLEEKKALEKATEKKEEQVEEKIANKKAEKLAKKKHEKATESIAEKAPEKIAEKAPEKIAEQTSPGDTTKPTVPEIQSPRKAAESKGVLAFKNDLANLLKESSTSKMGADAHITITAKKATSDFLQRSIVVSQASGNSGGINTATLNRQSEVREGTHITDVEVKTARVESPVSVVTSGADLPLSKGGASSRTDEEIQVVFDQYKSALYRIYNRELRIDPTLRGKMVLRIVIEPDGHVSECIVKSTDMASAALSADIVSRVLKFDFGPKKGAPAITILYPIAFLPSN